jgi:hypothetical protein
MIITPAAPRLVTINCDIGISVETRLVKINQFSALGFSQFTIFDSLRYLPAKSIV